MFRFKLPYVGLLALLLAILYPTFAGAAVAAPPADPRIEVSRINGSSMRCMLAEHMLGVVEWSERGSAGTGRMVSPQACDGDAGVKVRGVDAPDGITFQGDMKTTFGTARVDGIAYPAFCTNTPGNAIVFYNSVVAIEYYVPNICQASKA